MRILDLKGEVNDLLVQAGRPSRYGSAEPGTPGDESGRIAPGGKGDQEP
jgi:hypothetical protein